MAVYSLTEYKKNLRLAHLHEVLCQPCGRIDLAYYAHYDVFPVQRLTVGAPYSDDE